MEEKRICKKCGEEKEIISFDKYKSGKNYYRCHTCRRCKYLKLKLDPIKYELYREKSNERRKRFYENNKEYDINRAKEYHKNNKDKSKNSNIKYRYNLNIEEYYKIKEKQNNCCAICGKNEQLLNKSLHIDHCHKTHKVRGLLCSRCNLAIGAFEDNIEYLKNAIIYLEKI